jgi:hypothetical protein
MKYVKLRLYSADRELLYERDFANEAFGPFITLTVGNLAEQGTLREGELFFAELIPRYQPAHAGRPLLLPPTAPLPSAIGWTGLRLEEPVRADEPIEALTLELYLIDRGLICRSDHPVAELIATLLSPDLESNLVSLGLMCRGERYQVELLACDDDRAELTRERMPPLDRRSTQLVEILPDADPAPCRPPPVFNNGQLVGKISDEDVCIYIARSELASLHEEGRLSTSVERGGVLVGEVYQEGNRFVVEVSGSIIHEDRDASAVAFRYTSRSWQEGAARLRERFPDKKIVGWYHTHLVETVTEVAPDVLGLTAMFFSRDDVFVHRHFYPDPWYVALVLDPWGNCIFFQWKNGDVVACDGYYLYDGPGGGT